jgi:hypothetical protein
MPLRVATGQQPLGSCNRTSRLPAATTLLVLLKRLSPQTACLVWECGEAVDERMRQTGRAGGNGGDKCVGRCVWMRGATLMVEFSNRTWTKGSCVLRGGGATLMVVGSNGPCQQFPTTEQHAPLLLTTQRLDNLFLTQNGTHEVPGPYP